MRVSRVAREELVRKASRATVAELELAVSGGEVGEPWGRFVQAAGTQVHRKPSHLAGATEERSSAHRRQLLQPPLLAPLVLEPDLQQKSV